MKASEVYRKAAYLIESGREEYSCIAIGVSAGYGSQEESILRDKYVETFTDEVGDTTDYQLAIYKACREELGTRDDDWERDFRVLALCFMAAMSERSPR